MIKKQVMKKLGTLTLVLLTHFLFAQNEGNVWYFGNKIGVDFNNGSPVQLSDSQMEAFEGCASISDANGNLLFYTDGGGQPPASGMPGGTIWNRNHEVVYEMQGSEGGGNSARQSAVFIPKPGTANIYLLFTMEQIVFDEGGPIAGQPEGRGLSYFEIDLSLNGGLGGIAVADERVLVPAYEGLCAVRHSNGTDYWIIVRNATTNQLNVFPVTVDGVGSPAVYDAPGNGSGYIKASPNGQHLFVESDVNTLYNFDPFSGDISSPVTVDFMGEVGEFSPNSRYFYGIALELLNDSIGIIQIDLEADDVPASANLIATTPFFDENTGGLYLSGQIQVAPDGNIYFILFNATSSDYFLSAINCPSTSDASVDFFALPLTVPDFDSFDSFFGLPNFSNHLFASDTDQLTLDLGPAEQSVCIGTPVEITAQTNGIIDSWSTGETTTTISINTPGVYAVTVSNDCSVLIDSVTVIPASGTVEVNIQGASFMCEGGSISLEALGTAGVTYLWSTGSTEESIVVESPDIYRVTVTDGCGATAEDSLAVSRLPIPEAGIIASGELECPNDQVRLSANFAVGTSLMWSTGASNSIISVGEPGWYWVETFNECGTDRDSVFLESEGRPYPEARIIGGDQPLCEGRTVTLSIETNTSGFWTWSNGFVLTDSIVVDSAGEYQLTFINECGRVVETVELSEEPPVEVTIDGPTRMCEGEGVVLNANSPTALSYEWSDGSVEDSFGSYYSGQFSVSVTDVCGDIAIANHSVTAIPEPTIIMDVKGTLWCEDDVVILSADTADVLQLEWSTGEVGTEISTDQPGFFSLSATNECFEKTESVRIGTENVPIYVPNAFSPNGDGQNDVFAPMLQCNEVADFQFHVYSRWGNQLFESKDLVHGWDGIFNGALAPVGVYVWRVNFSIRGNPYVLQGDVTLVR